ncbi:MAG: cytochrome c [Flavobacterium sp.]
MKYNFFTLAAITLFMFSCGTQKNTPVNAAQSAETANTVALTPELAEGQTLYSNNCAKCHKLFEPKKFTQEEWHPILVKMQKKAKLDDVQMASITNYIHSQL